MPLDETHLTEGVIMVHEFYEWSQRRWRKISAERFGEVEARGLDFPIFSTPIPEERVLRARRNGQLRGDPILLMRTDPREFVPWSDDPEDEIVGGSTKMEKSRKRVNWPLRDSNGDLFLRRVISWPDEEVTKLQLVPS